MVLLAVSVVAGAVLTARGARFFDVTVGLGLLLAAGYYVYTIVTGQVTALVPGEPGSGVLPGRRRPTTTHRRFIGPILSPGQVDPPLGLL